MNIGGITILGILAIAAAAITWNAGTTIAALAQPRKRRQIAWPEVTPPISIIVPVRAPAPALTACAKSLALLDYPDFEIILCAEDDDADAIELTQRTALEYEQFTACSSRISATANPKAALLDAGIQKARHDLLLLSDDNVVSPPNRLRTLVAYRNAGYGLVSNCVLGADARNFWGDVDRAFMNGHFARLQCAGDLIGLSFATGKSMFLSRADLQRSGGVGSIGATLCEDAELQRQLGAAGVRTALSHDRLLQPIGLRTFSEVWQRHLRWAMCRRQYAFLFFVGEALLSAPVASISAAIAGASLNVGFAPGLAAAATTLMAIEWAFLRISGAAPGWRFPAFWLTREMLALPIWFAALSRRRTVIWRTRLMNAHNRFG